MAMQNSPHPDIRQNSLTLLGLNVTVAARGLGVARHTLSRLLNGHADISPKMAMRLEKGGQCRVLAVPTGSLGSRAGTQERRPDQGRVIPAATRFLTRCRSNEVAAMHSSTMDCRRDAHLIYELISKLLLHGRPWACQPERPPHPQCRQSCTTPHTARDGHRAVRRTPSRTCRH